MSLRRTLAVRYSLTMAAALLAIAVWAYVGVRHTLVDQLEESLRTTYRLQSLNLAAQGRVTPTPGGMPEAYVRDINRLVIVRDSSGHIVQANTDLARTLALDPARLEEALAGRIVAYRTTWTLGSALAIAGPVPRGGPPGTAVVEVGASLAQLEGRSRAILYRMLLTALLGSLATLVGAWWLAGSALSPVREITEQADRIQGTTSGERITVHAHVEEMRGLVQVLNAMLGRLERAHQWHRHMIRDLGHDLRTPITTMRASIEVALLGHRTADEYRRVLASTLEEVDRLALIGDGLSLLGRLESGALTARLERRDVRPLVLEAVARARDRVGGHPVFFEPPAEPMPAGVDARLFGLALDQLLDNAVRHTPSGTRVDVALGHAGGRLTITVEDAGPGVPDSLLPHLFERFYRADAARGRESGPGLGLTVVAVITDLHHGRATAERGPGGGLRVRLELPRPTPF